MDRMMDWMMNGPDDGYWRRPTLYIGKEEKRSICKFDISVTKPISHR